MGGAEPHAYLADVITRIVNDHPNSQIDGLLPWAYLTTQQRWRWPENIAYADHLDSKGTRSWTVNT